MIEDRAIVVAWISAAASSIVSDVEDAANIARRLRLAPALAADMFAAEAVDLVRIVAENVNDAPGYAVLAVVEVQAGESRDFILLLSAIALSLAVGRIAWPSRPSAREARSLLQAHGEQAYAIAASRDAILYSWLRDLVQTAVRIVSEIAADATPMVQVTTPISIPSTVAAYHLYGDANRAGNLVDIARSATPMLMPSTFDALAK